MNIETIINFVDERETYNRNLTVDDDIFTYAVALFISYENLDLKPKSVVEC